MTQMDFSAARQLMLYAQGLLTPPETPADKAAVLACIQRMGVLQIDTIHVIARSPYMVLFSRLGDYQTKWLEEHLAEGHLFEYWSHAACFIPIEDFRFYRQAMLDRVHVYHYPRSWFEERQALVAEVLERIRVEGPLRSADFTPEQKKGGGWWNWKEEKQILEYLFNLGELMITRRDKFQRVYDLPARVFPGWADNHLPDEEERQRELVLRTVRCLGVARPEWTADYFRLSKRGIPELLESLCQAGRLIPVQVEGLEGPCYVHPDLEPALQAVQRGELQATHSCLLSPFDPLVWDRNRTRQLFGLDFSLEAYLPQPKRRFGYYCLPVLQRGRLVGRLDAKAHRKERRFEVINFYMEPNVALNDMLIQDVKAAVQRCADWHACPEVVYSAAQPAFLLELFNS
jgi:uncharacterized protein YcaQ